MAVQDERYPEEPGEPRPADSAQGGQLHSLNEEARMGTYNFSLVIAPPTIVDREIRSTTPACSIRDMADDGTSRSTALRRLSPAAAATRMIS